MLIFDFFILFPPLTEKMAPSLSWLKISPDRRNLMNADEALMNAGGSCD